MPKKLLKLDTEQETPLRAYLATALTDLPTAQRDAVYEVCKRIKEECRKFGIVLYLPFEHTDPHAHASIPAQLVYDTDSRQVLTSDLLFVLCVAASYGVGQENQIALAHGVPVVYLIQKGWRVSRMLLGSPTRSCTIDYEDAADLLTQLSRFLAGTVSALRKRRQCLGNPGCLGVGKRVKDLRQRMDLSVEALADLVGVGANFITKLEEEEVEAGLTLMHIRTLAVVLGQSIDYLLLGATGRIDEGMRRSRENLHALARDEDMQYADYERLWQAYQDSQRDKIGFVSATRNSQIISKEQWRVWYRKILEKRSDFQLDF